MIDAMCSECLHLSCSVLSAQPGWKCAKDAKDAKDEHDPTDQACAKFRRRREAVMLVSQDIPVAVKPTGNVERDAEGKINYVEVAPHAAHWEGLVAWVQPHKLIWANTPSDVASLPYHTPVSGEELEQVCGIEAAVVAAMSALLQSGERIGLGVARAAAEGLVEAVRELSLPIIPADLVALMRKTGKLGDLVSGVSAHHITMELARSGALARWGVAGFVKQEE